MTPLRDWFKAGAAAALARFGVKAAAAAMEKVAIGQRQQKRIADAFLAQRQAQSREMSSADRLEYNRRLWAQHTQDPHAWSMAYAFAPPDEVRKKVSPEDIQSARDFFSPAGALDYGKQRKNDEIRQRLIAGLKRPEAGNNSPVQSPDDLRRLLQTRYDLVDFARAEREMVSGRHRADDIVDLPMLDTLTPGSERARPGVHPDRIAWRSAAPLADLGDGPRWFSGIPDVSAGYSQRLRPLQAYDHTQIPDANKGPWTPHIAKDPRQPGVDITTRQAGTAAIGASPIYERVIDAPHIPAPLTTYKPLPTLGRFMRVRGPNLLRGVKP